VVGKDDQQLPPKLDVLYAAQAVGFERSILLSGLNMDKPICFR
jgi:hypothetical protein